MTKTLMTLLSTSYIGLDKDIIGYSHTWLDNHNNNITTEGCLVVLSSQTYIEKPKASMSNLGVTARNIVHEVRFLKYLSGVNDNVMSSSK